VSLWPPKQDDVAVLSSPGSSVREWWGVDLSDDAILRLRDAPMEHWVAFSRYYDQPVPQNLDPGKAAGMRSEAFCSLNSKPDELYDAAVMPLGAARVRALALLVHRVVVADPIEKVVRGFITATDTTCTEPPNRTEVEATLRVLAELAPLEDAGAVIYKSSARGVGTDTDAILNTLLLEQDLKGLELDWRWATDPHGLRSDGSAILAGLNIVMDVIQARQLVPTGSVLVGTPLERSVLEHLVALGGATLPGRAVAMQHLGTLALPTLIPGASAVVAAREADEYVQLRNELSRALESIQALPDTDESWLEDARTALADEMAPGAARLRKALRRSGVLAQLRQTAAGLGVSGLGALAGDLVGGSPVVAATSAGVTSLAAVLRTYLSARPAVRGQRAVLESYLMFGEPRGLSG
jgi:hypothetical protein